MRTNVMAAMHVLPIVKWMSKKWEMQSVSSVENAKEYVINVQSPLDENDMRYRERVCSKQEHTLYW